MGDGVPSGDVASMQGQDEKAEAEIEETSDEYRAEAREEVRNPKPVARPYTPTRAEIYEHEVSHLPYRSWRRHCVHGRGVSSPPCETRQIGKAWSYDQYGLLLYEWRVG